MDININEYVEYTLLKPYCADEEVKKICEDAIQHQFKAVCVTPYQVKNAKAVLNNSPVLLVSVVGFPFGYHPTPSKVEEAKKLIDLGADELDMVMNIGALKNGDLKTVINDIESVTTLIHIQNKVVKVIIETGILTDKEIKKACEIAVKSGVNFVKTSSGYTEKGASVEAVKLIRKCVPESVKIKASGGIAQKQFALELIQAGAQRIGTSSALNFIQS